jgi:hypothetical protein
MPAYIPSLDGYPVFGTAVHMPMVPAEVALARVEYFGVNGVGLVSGGGRGRTFSVTGVLGGSSLSALAGARGSLLSFNDGLSHQLFDTWGLTWPYVVFTGGWHQGPLLFVAGGGLCFEYQLELFSNL